MLKEKDVYSTTNGSRAQSLLCTKDPSRAITAESVRKSIERAIDLGAYPAVVTEDQYSYKTGFMKSAVVPCLIISHAIAPKDFRKVVVIVKQNGQNTILENGWYGESKFDKVVKKVNKSAEQADRSFARVGDENRSLTDSFLSAGKGAFHSIKNRRLNKKADSLEEAENEYYEQIMDILGDLRFDMTLIA